MHELSGFGDYDKIKDIVKNMVDERYVFPSDDVYPWTVGYWTTPDIEHSDKCIYPGGVMPPLVRMNRQLFLIGSAYSIAFERRYMLDMVSYGLGTAWGVASMAICSGTYNAMHNSNITHLWRQSGLTGKNLGICPTKISKRQLLTKLKVFSETEYYGRVRLDEHDDNSQWMYWLKAAGRRQFCILSLMRRLLTVARVVDNKHSIGDALLKQWVEKFDHPEDIVYEVARAKPWPDSDVLNAEIERLEEEMDGEKPFLSIVKNDEEISEGMK